MTEKIKSQTDDSDPRDRGFAGALLLGVGVLALLLNITNSGLFGELILPGLGIAFLAWGFYTRRFGFMIPGCILTGLGAGVMLSQRLPGLHGSASGGVIVVGLALGFMGIALFGSLFQGERVLWPLLPGGMLLLIGGSLIVGESGLALLELLGTAWPIVIIAVGLYLVFAPRYRRQ